MSNTMPASAPEPIIVIGAGIAGLTAAAFLARGNVPVHLIEQHTLPGGYISSFERSRFIFPTGPSSFSSNGIVFPILKELGLDHKRHFVRVGHQLSWTSVDVAMHSLADMTEALIDQFPEDEHGLRAYFDLVETAMRGSQAMQDSGLYFSSPLSGMITMLGMVPKTPKFMWQMITRRKETNRTLHARYMRNSSLRRMLDQCGYPVMPYLNTMGMWQSFLADYWVPLGGMQAFANIFVRYIREHGGTVQYSSKVGRILIENNTAVGVELADGSILRTSAVIVAADIHHTCFDLIGSAHLSPTLIDKLGHGVASESVFSVFVGVNEQCECDGALKRFCESHVYFSCLGGEWLQIALLTKDDPSLAPAGKHALQIAIFSPYEDWQQWKANRNEAYEAHKAALTRQVIQLAEEFIPNLSRYIEVTEAATPLTYERYTGNWHGATVGWNWNPTGNPHIDLAHDFSVRNCYLCGHWTFSPAGVPAAMITGRYMALAAMAALNNKKQ